MAVNTLITSTTGGKHPGTPRASSRLPKVLMNVAAPVGLVVERIRRKNTSGARITRPRRTWNSGAFRALESRQEAADLGHVSASRAVAPEKEVPKKEKNEIKPSVVRSSSGAMIHFFGLD